MGPKGTRQVGWIIDTGSTSPWIQDECPNMSSAGADAAAGADLLAFLQVDNQKARYKEHTIFFVGVLFQSLLRDVLCL